MSDVSKEHQWRERIDTCINSGMSIKGWCKANQVSSYQYHYWKKKCDQLFSIERVLESAIPKEKYEKRLALVKPVWDAFLVWLKKVNALPQSALGKAVSYTLNQWPYLENYLRDGRCKISNNKAKQSIKPFVIGRKNFLFCNTTRGAQASAITYSIIETAKENNLNPFEYLQYLFKQLPNTNFKDNHQVLQGYLPWAKFPLACYSKNKEK